MQSRARTPSFGREDDVGYFGQFHHGLGRRKSAVNSLAGSWDGKRKSTSNESMESVASRRESVASRRESVAK
jgi:hypothetical protein